MPYRPDLKQGQMYYLSDEGVEFAENRDRLPHETKRCCVVIEGDPSLSRTDSAKVLIVPTSSQVHVKGPYDVYIPHPPAPNKPVYVRVEHMQPVLRDDLADFVQTLNQTLVDEIMASVAKYLNLV